MPRHEIRQELWDKLIASFRIAPGNAGRAATAADCDYRTARRAWERGFWWAKHPPYRQPMREIIDHEQEIARARLAALRDESAVQIVKAEEQLAIDERQREIDRRRQAETDATDSVVEEAQLVRLARGSALSILGSMQSLAEGAAKVGIKVQESLASYCVVEADGTPRKLTPLELGSLTRVIASLTLSLKQAIDASARAMEMERLLLGEPSRIIGVRHSVDDVSMAEAARRIRAAYEALEAARAEGIVVDSETPLLTSGGNGTSAH